MKNKEEMKNNFEGDFMQNSFWENIINDYENRYKEDLVEYGEWYEPHSKELLNMYKKSKILNTPAPIEFIKDVESRLDIEFPPSYIEFLKYSNGLLISDRFTNLLPVDNIDWFYNLNKEWVDVWTKDESMYDEVSDEEYYDYSNNQDSCKIREKYLKTALQISDSLEGDVLLLNPKVKFGKEWEAWWFSNAMPGAMRFKSFKELLIYLLSPQEEKQPLTEEELIKMKEDGMEKLSKSMDSALSEIFAGIKNSELSPKDILKEFDTTQEMLKDLINPKK